MAVTHHHPTPTDLPETSELDETLTIASLEPTAVSCHDQQHSYDVDKAKLLTRLRRIEGQVRGVARMIEEDQYCLDVLTQISAVISSSRAVGMLVLQDHIRGCVVDGPEDEREARLQELNVAIERFTKM